MYYRQTFWCGYCCARAMIKSGGLFSNDLYVSTILPASSGVHASINVRSASKHI